MGETWTIEFYPPTLRDLKNQIQNEYKLYPTSYKLFYAGKALEDSIGQDVMIPEEILREGNFHLVSKPGRIITGKEPVPDSLMDRSSVVVLIQYFSELSNTKSELNTIEVFTKDDTSGELNITEHNGAKGEYFNLKELISKFKTNYSTYEMYREDSPWLNRKKRILKGKIPDEIVTLNKNVEKLKQECLKLSNEIWNILRRICIEFVNVHDAVLEIIKFMPFNFLVILYSYLKEKRDSEQATLDLIMVDDPDINVTELTDEISKFDRILNYFENIPYQHKELFIKIHMIDEIDRLSIFNYLLYEDIFTIQ